MTHLLKTPPNPNVGWLRPIASVLGAIFVPALFAALYLMLFPLEASDRLASTGTLHWVFWSIAACLTAAPLFVLLILPLATPAVWLAVRFGWAGPVSLVAIGNGLGLPTAHIMLNGDVTTEAPAMIPVLMVAIGLQALIGWVFLTKAPWKTTQKLRESAK